MMLLLLAAAVQPIPVRPEPVEGLSFLARRKDGASTSSARTAEGASSAHQTKGQGEKRAAQTALDAERAFAADAQTIGQWSAFRKWAASDATMFVPQPTNAQAWLKDRKDPAKAIEWWPTASYVSCDGSLAVNTGGWKTASGTVGYFSTVWQRQQDGGWKWIVDGGDDLTVARPLISTLVSRKASCRGKVRPRPSALITIGGQLDGGQTADHSLIWRWLVEPDGSREFFTYFWNGRSVQLVIDDKIPPTK